MTKDAIRSAVLRILGAIAPEADLARIRPKVSFRDQLDIDSMDFLNFIIALNQELRVEIPEADYPQLATLEGCVEYLAARQPSGYTKWVEQCEQAKPQVSEDPSSGG